MPVTARSNAIPTSALVGLLSCVSSSEIGMEAAAANSVARVQVAHTAKALPRHMATEGLTRLLREELKTS